MEEYNKTKSDNTKTYWSRWNITKCDERNWKSIW